MFSFRFLFGGFTFGFLRLLVNFSLNIQDLKTFIFAAGGTDMVAQMEGLAVFAHGKTRVFQSEVRPTIIPMTSVGAHSYYHGQQLTLKSKKDNPLGLNYEC
jgi:hypothetical protein